MTEKRALKRLVRERMSHTGESYTTAHRQVSARAVHPSLPGLTPDYPAFGADAHGPSGLCRHLLGQAGIPVSEAMACGLGGGIGFLYAIFEYVEVPHPLLTIVAQHHPEPWLTAVTRHLGVSATTVTSSKPGPALTKLDSALGSGRAAHLVVGRGLLPWHPGVRPEESADPYAIVVAGKHGAEYLVDDRTAEPHRIGSEQLAEAWAAHRKGRFALTTIDAPQSAPDLPAGIRAAIRTTHAHLTGPVLGHSFDANMGLRGVRRLVDDLSDTTGTRGWARRFADPLAFETGMRRLAECLTWSHTAAGATRPIYSEFLAEAGPIAGLDLGAASATAAAAGASWMELADLAGSATPEHAPEQVLGALAELAASIVPLEEKLSRQLGAAIGAAD